MQTKSDSSEALTFSRRETEGASRRRWLVLGLVCLIYMLVSADRANLGIALPFIKKEFDVSNTQAGLLFTLMFLVYTAAQIPSGFLCRRFGPRTLMTLCLLLTAAASALISTSSTFRGIESYRSLLGLVEAPVTICCVAIINNWFTTTEKGTAAGCLFASSKLGPVLCPPLTVVVLHLYGWREIFWIFAIPVTLLACIWMIFIRDIPQNQTGIIAPCEGSHADSADGRMSSVAGLENAENMGKLDRLMRRKRVARLDTPGSVFRSWNVIAIALAYLCMVGILNVMLAWIPSYLLSAKHLSVSDMGLVSAAPFAGAVGANVVGGWISDRLLKSRRKPLMIIGALLTAMMFFLVIYAPDNAFLVGAMLFVLGSLFGLGYPAYSVYPMGMTTKEVYPVAFSLVNTAASLGAAVFPLVVGVILDHSHWEVVFYFLGISSLFSFTLLLSVDEPIPYATSVPVVTSRVQ